MNALINKILVIVSAVIVLFVLITALILGSRSANSLSIARLETDKWRDAYVALHLSKTQRDTAWLTEYLPAQNIDIKPVVDSFAIHDTVLIEQLAKPYSRTYADSVLYDHVTLFYKIQVAGLLQDASFSYRLKYPVITETTIYQPPVQPPAVKPGFKLGFEAGWQKDAYVGAWAIFKNRWGVRYNYNKESGHGGGLTYTIINR